MILLQVFLMKQVLLLIQLKPNRGNQLPLDPPTPGSNGSSLCWHSSKREAFLHDGQPTMDSVRWLYKWASKPSFDG